MRADTFEKALHCWDKWLESIEHGRKTLPRSTPMDEMRNIARKALHDLEFPTCPNFELYWLCCVFCDYRDNEKFYFDKIVIPEWFPLPFGFSFERFTSLRGERIYPADVWNESDVAFWTRGTYSLDPETAIVLSEQHPVKQYVNKGRPSKKNSKGGWVGDR